MRRSLVRATLLTLAALATPAAAAPLDDFAEHMVLRRLVTPAERTYVVPVTPARSADELAVLDGLAAALLKLKVPVLRDQTLPGEGPEAYLRNLKALRELGATRLLTYSWNGASGVARVVDVNTGLLLATEAFVPSGLELGEGAAPTSGALLFPNREQAAGLQVSWLSGSGLTYRRWLGESWGLQVAAIPYFTGTGANTSGFVNAGGQLMYTAFRNDRWRLYGVLGVGVMYYTGSEYSYDSATQTSKQVPTATTLTGVAPGVGLDYMLTPNLALTAALGYTVGTQTVAKNGTPSTGSSFSPGATLGTMLCW